MPTAADLMKPYLWLATLGFLVGFLSYVAVHPARSDVTVDLPQGWAATVSEPASAPSSGDWNFAKLI